MEGDRFLYETEDQQLQEQIVLEQNKFIQECEPPEWLKDAKYPFMWLTMLQKRSIPEKIVIKPDENHHTGFFFNFNRMMQLLSLATMKSMGWYQQLNSDSDVQDDEDELDKDTLMPSDIPKDCDHETLFALLQEILDQMAADGDKDLSKRIGHAIDHVTLATKSHMLYLKGAVAESREIASNIIPVAEMSLENQGGIEGIKMAFILDISNEYETAFEAGLRAIELDPQWALWPFLAGIILRRKRHTNGYEMPSEELQYFEKALELEKSVHYMLFLARSYLERSQWLIRNDNESLAEIDDLQRKAVELYREIWTLEKDSYITARRVGTGLMKIKEKLTDLSMAKEALTKAMETRPCQTMAHALGRFYYRLEQDDEKALECFNKFRGYFCTSEIIRIKLLQDPDYDPYDIMQEWIEKYDSVIKTSRQDTTYCDVGWYYLAFKRDLNMAVSYFWKVLKKDYKSSFVMEYRSYPFYIKSPLNIIQILVNEIMMLKERNESLPPEGRKDLTYLNNFLDKVYEKHPDLVQMKPNPNLLKFILQGVKRYIYRLRKERYRNSRCRGESIGDQEAMGRAKGDRQEVTRGNVREVKVARSEYYRQDSDSKGVGLDQASWRKSSNQENTREDCRKTKLQRRSNRYDTTVTNWRTENTKPS